MRKFYLGIGLVAALALLAAPQAAWAQSSQTTGQIIGSVSEASGGPLPGVTVEAKNADTGFRRTAITDGAGFFRLDLLPSGVYDVRAALAGFRTEIQKGVTVSLGSSVHVDYLMSASQVEEEIVVTAEAPIIETTNPSVAASVGEESIQNLPLQGRDFTDFAILVPGTVAADDSQQSSRGGLHVGARAIQNSFNIDGSNNQSSFFGEERGGTRPPFTFSQAAIKEFQIVKSGYNLQYNSSGGVLNAITMSGTNDLKGQVFGYYTDDGMKSKDGKGFDPNTYEQLQYGFAVGGPIVRDQIHFFGSYDGQRYTTPYEAIFEDFPVDRQAEWESITGLDYENEVGQIDQTNDADVFMVKLDWQLSDSHLMTLRDNYSVQEGENLTASYSNTGRSNNGFEENNFNSFVGSLNSVFSESAFNELIVQVSSEERPRTANNTVLPDTGVYRYRAAWGQLNYLPNSLDEDRFQVIDNFTYYLGAHTLKAGVNIDMVSFDNVFYRYSAGQYSYSSWDDFFNDEPYYYQQSFSDYEGQIKFDVDYYSLYLQDEWRASPNLSVTYGLRYDLQDNPTPQVSNPLYPDTAKIPNDTDNFAPRVGFAWDVKGDGKSVVRGGVGMFYDNTPTLLLSNSMNDNGLRTVTIREYCNWGDCPAYGSGGWSSQGDLEGGTPTIKVMSPDFENAETWRMSLGYEREILADFSMGVDVIYSESKKLERSQNQNIAPNGGFTIDGLPTYDTGLDPNFDEINQYTSDVRADYTSIVLKARKRYSNGWMLDASYTWSEAEDSNSNERSTTSYPMDQYNLGSSWGPSNFDTTHKFVLSGSYQLPWDFVFSGIIYIRSGFPYSAMDGRDTNTDGEGGNEFALIENEDGSFFRYGRNTFRQPYHRNMDLRLSKTFSFGSDYELELMIDFFNVTDEENWYTTNDSLVDRYGNIEDNFGELDEVGDPRSYQFGARFRF